MAEKFFKKKKKKLPPASHHDRASRAISWSVAIAVTAVSARPTIPGQGVRSPNSRAVGSSLDFSLNIAPAAEPGAVAGWATTDHDLAHVLALKIADADAPVIGALAVQLASWRQCSRVPLHQEAVLQFNSEARTPAQR